MAMKPYRGSGYYGRRRRKLVVFLLLLLLLIGVFVFFYAQEYIVFTADGFRFSFRASQPAEPDPEPVTPPDIVIDEPVDPPEPNPDPDPVPDDTPDDDNPPPEQTYQPTRALWVPKTADFVPGNIAEPLNGLAMTIKDVDGALVLSADSSVSSAVSALRQSGGRAVALASALRDNTAPRNDFSLSVRTHNGVRWLDYNYISWVNPYAEGAADFLAALAQSCYDAGFDELVLQNFQFPTVGKTSLLNYGQQPLSRTEALSALLSAVRERAPDELEISVVLTDTAASSLVDADAGQDVSLLAPHCAHLYVAAADPAFDLSALQTAMADSGCKPALLLSAQTPPEQELEYILLP